MPETNTSLSAANLDSNLPTSRILLGLGIVLGAIYAYSYRFGISPDGVSYLDVARAYVRHDWGMAVNGWWSPLYSWILAVSLWVRPPTSHSELPLVHVVNFLCFVLASWSFHRFWQALWLLATRESDEQKPLHQLAPVALDLFGYGFFFLLFLPLIAAATPDVLASALVFLVAERLLQMKANSSATLYEGILLGVLLALAYFAKTILFYFSAAALTVVWLRSKPACRKALTASTAVFLVLLCPWAGALHHTFGRWTLGFSGPLNYAWFIDGTVTKTYPGPVGAPLPYFPGDKVFSTPSIYAVPTHADITYVPWYDPARFDHTDHPHFQWRGQIAAIRSNLVWLCDWLFLRLGAVTIVVLVLVFCSGTVAGSLLLGYSEIAVPALLVFGMYILVFVRTPRYIAALTVVLFSILLACVRLSEASRTLVRVSLAAGFAIFLILNLPALTDAARGLFSSAADPVVEVAEDLAHSGIAPDSRVATIGAGVYAYWAHLARIEIASEVWDEDASLFWNSDVARQKQMLCAISKTGAIAVIGHPRPATNSPGWEPLGESGYWMHKISPAQCE